MFKLLKNFVKRKLSTFVQAELSYVKTELTQTKTELTQTKTELAQTKTELAQTKTELAQTKTELAQTKTELAQTKTEIYNLFHQSKRNQKTLISNLRHVSSIKQNKNVVYTCLTGNYDQLYLPEYIDNDWDYVCFTDNENLLKNDAYGIWKIYPLQFSELDNTRNNRWHKTHPHVLFPNYERSLYIDSNLIIRSDWIFREINKRNNLMIIPSHFERNCIYEEIAAVKSSRKDDEQRIQKMIDFLSNQPFPHNYGMNENNCIYRKHNEPLIVEMMEEWWSFIRDFSKRDQLSLSYVLWKHGIKPSDIAIPNLRTKYKDFQFINHLTANNERTFLPDYPMEQADIQYYIEFIKTALDHSFVSGWAFLKKHKGHIFIGDINHRIYVTAPDEVNLTFTGGNTKFGKENEIYKPTEMSRPEVQQAFSLDTSEVGFSFETDTFISDFKIYIVDEDEKKIFYTEYHI